MEYEALDSVLTENEKKVYLALLKIGETTASKILKKTGLQNSVFYRTIHRLMEKGFVTYVLKGKIKHFKAASPEMFLTQIKRKESEIKELIPQLKEIQESSQNFTTAEVFVGMKGILSMYYSLIENAKKGEKYYFFGPKEDSAMDAMKDVYVPFRLYREERGIVVYGLNQKNIKKYISKPSKVQEKFVDFPLPPNMAIFRNKVVLVSWGEIPTGILIESKDIAEQYKELFLDIWKRAG
jgi:sugar-specific transcriptional regulator TrmB